MGNLKDTVQSISDTETATIASGATTSGEISLGGLRLFRLNFPAAMTGTILYFQVYDQARAAFVDLYNGASKYSVAVVNGSQPVDYTLFASIDRIKLVSGSTEAADRAIGLALRAI